MRKQTRGMASAFLSVSTLAPCVQREEGGGDSEDTVLRHC